MSREYVLDFNGRRILSAGDGNVPFAVGDDAVTVIIELARHHLCAPISTSPVRTYEAASTFSLASSSRQ
ncbi:hypothetical protein ACFWAY_47640 [Rhodococcus sp. NPDC059968]|uniref:hypothetical protein n=1 Tax=Rhodococcus sp. NPDC059968 TaxID=3347017 RepID=UPI0036719234